MKQGLLASYFAGIVDKQHGQSYWRIIRYFWPEFITSFVIFALPFWIDSYLVSFLKSTPAYATLGTTNNTLHLLFKIAEAFSIGAVITVGNYNGLGEYKKAGHVFRDAFWIAVGFGILFSLLLYFTAEITLRWLNLSSEIITLGIPFWRLRAIGIFFMFVYLAILGFFRGIKNTRVPMYIYIIGAVTFIMFDYSLMFGAFGFPELGFNGSAWASLIQNITMTICAILFIFFNNYYQEYQIELFNRLPNFAYYKELLLLIFPVAIDKATLAFAYIWLSKMLNLMGTCSTASFCAIKDLERFAFLPAIALAQVLTFLVSNDYGIQNWAGIKSNLKKVIFLASVMVLSILALFSVYPASLMKIFDKTGDFTPLTVKIFPILSVLVFFDLVQLVLSGALRGAGDVKVVMWTRLVICIGYFVPVSYILVQIPIADPAIKFLLVYGSFYVGNGLMSIVYINRLRGPKWKRHEL